MRIRASFSRLWTFASSESSSSMPGSPGLRRFRDASGLGRQAPFVQLHFVYWESISMTQMTMTTATQLFDDSWTLNPGCSKHSGSCSMSQAWMEPKNWKLRLHRSPFFHIWDLKYEIEIKRGCWWKLNEKEPGCVVLCHSWRKMQNPAVDVWSHLVCWSSTDELGACGRLSPPSLFVLFLEESGSDWICLLHRCHFSFWMFARWLH